MYFNELSDAQRRAAIDLRQAHEAWLAAEREMRHRFAGTMRWRTKGSTDYLFRKVGTVERGLGKRGPETEEAFRSFTDGRERAKDRLKGLVEALDVQAAIARAVGLGRAPVIVAKVLRLLDEVQVLGHIRVVGTNALFAYEALAGVAFAAEALATGDMDLLLDARNRLRIMVPNAEERSILALLRKIDRSFEVVPGRGYRVANRDGYMVDLIRPQPRPAWKDEAGARPLADGDLEPSPIEGLQWLVNSPSVEAMVVDARGYPAPIVAPDPRVWMLHKLWLSDQPLRDPLKKRRDAGQALAVHRLLESQLRQFPFDPAFLARLPAPLRAQAEKLPTKEEEGDEDHPRPNW